MRRRGENQPEDPDQRAGDLQVGQFVKSSPYDGLTDEQADALQAELEAREKRRLPFGFRSREVS